MWVANKPFRYRGVRYNAGDRVPAETWPSRRALVSMRKLRHEVDPLPKAEDYPLTKMKREELNALAVQMGILNPDKMANREAIIEAIKSLSPDSTEDDASGDSGGSTPDDTEDELSEDDDSEDDEVETPEDDDPDEVDTPEDEVLVEETEAPAGDVIIAGEDDIDFSEDND